MKNTIAKLLSLLLTASLLTNICLADANSIITEIGNDITSFITETTEANDVAEEESAEIPSEADTTETSEPEDDSSFENNKEEQGFAASSSALTYNGFEYEIYYNDTQIINTVRITRYIGSETDIIIPDRFAGDIPVYSIGSEAFAYNTKIKSITIPLWVDDIAPDAFAGCNNEFTIYGYMDSAAQIHAAANNMRFVDLRLRYTISDDGTSVFITGYVYSDTYPNHIIIPDKIGEKTVTAIERYAFYSFKTIESITLPATITYIYSRAFLKSGIKSIEIDPNNPAYTSTDGVLFDKDMHTLICYPPGKDESTYYVPDGVLGIDYYAFEGATNLIKLVMPDTMGSFRPYSISDCPSLRSVVIGRSSVGFEDNTFYNADSATIYGVLNSSVHKFAKANNINFVGIYVTVNLLTEMTDQPIPATQEYSLDNGVTWNNGQDEPISVTEVIDSVPPEPYTPKDAHLLIRLTPTSSQMNDPNFDVSLAEVSVRIKGRYEYKKTTESLEEVKVGGEVKITGLKPYRRFEYKINDPKTEAGENELWKPLYVNGTAWTGVSDVQSTPSFTETRSFNIGDATTIYLRVRAYNDSVAHGTLMFSSGEQHTKLSYTPTPAEQLPPIPVGSFTVNWRTETTNEIVPNTMEYKWANEPDSAYITGTNEVVDLNPEATTKELIIRRKATDEKLASSTYSLPVGTRGTSAWSIYATLIPTGTNHQYKVELSKTMTILQHFIEFTDDNGTTWKPIVFVANGPLATNVNRGKEDWAAASGVEFKISEPIKVAPGVSTIKMRIAANDGKKRDGTNFDINPDRAKCFAGTAQVSVNVPQGEQRTEGSIYIVTLKAENADSEFLSGAKTITYDSKKLELIDFAMQAPGANKSTGTIEGTGLTITNISDGKIGFTVSKTIPSGVVWDGNITVLQFKVLQDGIVDVRLS